MARPFNHGSASRSAGYPPPVSGGAATFTVSGVANDELGQVLATTAMSICTAGGAVVGGTTTNGSGAFSFAGIAAGSYRFRTSGYDDTGAYSVSGNTNVGTIVFPLQQG